MHAFARLTVVSRSLIVPGKHQARLDKYSVNAVRFTTSALYNRPLPPPDLTKCGHLGGRSRGGSERNRTSDA